MTACGELDTRIEDYLAGHLAPEAVEALERHAGACARCGELLERRTRLPVVLARDVAPPPAVRAATLRRIGAAARRRHRRRIAVPAALAASLLLAWGVTRPTDKAAMMRAREATSPLAMAEARASAEFEALARARSAVERALIEAAPAERARLEAERARLARQHDRLVTIVQEFES